MLSSQVILLKKDPEGSAKFLYKFAYYCQYQHFDCYVLRGYNLAYSFAIVDLSLS